MNTLPLLNSERKEYDEKVRQAKVERDNVRATLLQQVTRIINTAKFLEVSQKDELLKLIRES